MRLNYALGVSVPVKFWDAKKNQAKESKLFPEHLQLNNMLISKCAKIFKCFHDFQEQNENKYPTEKQLKFFLDLEFKKTFSISKSQNSFLEFLKKLVKDSESGIRVQPQSGKSISLNTIKTYRTALAHLEDYYNSFSRSINFEDITLEFYEQYKTYLMKELNLSNNTVGKNFQIIKLAMNEAFDKGVTNNIAFRSKRFFVIRETADNIFLTQEEIEALMKIDLSKSKNLELTRDLFVIGCMTGLRFSDLSSIKPENIEKENFLIKQIKTGVPIVIPLNKTILTILKKYGGNVPRAYSNQKTNVYLKEICQKENLLQIKVTKEITKGGHSQKLSKFKWEMVSTHTARRSFATNEVKNGTPISLIMALTGHTTEKSFWKYVKFGKADYANAYKLLIDKR